MIRIALIGLGNIARHHAAVITDLRGARLVAGVKRDRPTGLEFCREFGIPEYFVSADDLLAWGQFDAAVVSVGHCHTVKVARAVLETGRPCLIEKPVGFNAKETASVAKVAAKAETWGMVGVNRRFYSNIRKALHLADKAGGLKALLVQQPEWIHQSKSWGLAPEVLDRYFLVNGIHLIDLMCHAAGMPEQICAIARTESDRRNSYDAFFAFPGKVPGHYVSQWYAPGRWTMDFFARDLRIRFHSLENATVQRTGGDEKPLPLDSFDRRYKAGFHRQMKTFVDAVAAGREPAAPACLLAEAVEVMKVLEAVAGGEGKLDRIRP
jgi:predicted dehydrogenase